MFNFQALKKTFVVAEISANHGQDFERACSMVEKAARCGVDAVKFQCYTPDTLTIDSDKKSFRIEHEKWGGQTLYELYSKAYTPWEWFPRLKKTAEDAGIVFFATVFDKTSVDFLEKLNVPFHKIASFELTDLPLIEYAAKTGKPLILSTGMATIKEIEEAVNVSAGAGARELMLLKCTSSYPAQPEEMHLRTITDMQERFSAPVGLSDHSLGHLASLAAVSLGAVFIEKHFTLDRKLSTPDSFFSVEPGELKELVTNIRIIEKILGKICYGATKSQKKARCFRRSLFAVEEIARGDKFNSCNVRSIRPGSGLPPRFIKDLIGRSASRNISRGTPMNRGMVE